MIVLGCLAILGGAVREGGSTRGCQALFVGLEEGVTRWLASSGGVERLRWLGQVFGVIFPPLFSQITRRYAEFSSALVSINQTIPNERTMQLLGQLQVKGNADCPTAGLLQWAGV